MALSDWTQETGATAISATTTQVYEGSRSLLFDNPGGTPKVMLLNDSIGSGALQARVTSQVYLTGTNNSYPGLALRFNPSTHEGIFLVLGEGTDSINLFEGEVTSTEAIETEDTYDPYTLNSWEEFQFTVYGSDTELTAIVERRTNQNDPWIQAADSITWNPSITSGGAVGVCHNADNTSPTDKSYLDNTFIGWPNP